MYLLFPNLEQLMPVLQTVDRIFITGRLTFYFHEEFTLERFCLAPKVVIYDNACGLHAYCLNQDPIYFQRTVFPVDRFHWKNHKGTQLTLSLAFFITVLEHFNVDNQLSSDEIVYYVELNNKAGNKEPIAGVKPSTLSRIIRVQNTRGTSISITVRELLVWMQCKSCLLDRIL